MLGRNPAPPKAETDNQIALRMGLFDYESPFPLGEKA